MVLCAVSYIYSSYSHFYSKDLISNVGCCRVICSKRISNALTRKLVIKKDDIY